MAEHKFNKKDNPTEWAQNMAEDAISVDEAVELLNETFPIRSVSETISIAIRETADRLNITEDSARTALESQVGGQTVVRWLTSGRTKAIKREKAIVVAFALQMPYVEAEKLLKKLWLDGFHMRNINDVVYRYGLENGWDYKTANDMIQDFEAMFPNITETNIESRDGDNDKGTEFLNLQYEKGAKTKEEFAEFVRQNEKHFGSYRRTAYELFKMYFDELKEEWSTSNDISNEVEIEAGGELPAYTHDGVSDAEIGERIIQAIPNVSSNETLDQNLRNLIVQNIPGGRSIRQAMSEILNQYRRPETGVVTQVDRKLLLLAYLSSKNSCMFEEKTMGNFKEHIEIINDDILRRCGMATLDSRHPFDWIIMNSLFRAYYNEDDYATDDLQDLVDRLRGCEEEDE